MNPTQKLQSMEEIRRVKARFFRCVDTQRWDDLREVFADDVEIDLTAIGGGVLEGADAFVQFLREILSEATTIHLGHTPEITVTSPTTASAIWMLHDILIVGGTRTSSYGHLHDEYIEQDGTWLIARSVVTQILRETGAAS